LPKRRDAGCAAKHAGRDDKTAMSFDVPMVRDTRETILWNHDTPQIRDAGSLTTVPSGSRKQEFNAMGVTTACAAPASESLPAAPIRFSTADYSPRDRLAAWREIYGQTMVKVDIAPIETEAFDIDIRMRRLPGLSIMTGSRSAAVYRRTPRHIDCDDLVISLGLAGPFEVSQSGRTASMAQGDAVMLISGEPGCVTVPSNGRWINLCVPQGAVPGLSANF